MSRFAGPRCGYKKDDGRAIVTTLVVYCYTKNNRFVAEGYSRVVASIFVPRLFIMWGDEDGLETRHTCSN